MLEDADRLRGRVADVVHERGGCQHVAVPEPLRPQAPVDLFAVSATEDRIEQPDLMDHGHGHEHAETDSDGDIDRAAGEMRLEQERHAVDPLGGAERLRGIEVRKRKRRHMV